MCPKAPAKEVVFLSVQAPTYLQLFLSFLSFSYKNNFCKPRIRIKKKEKTKQKTLLWLCIKMSLIIPPADWSPISTFLTLGGVVMRQRRKDDELL